MIGPRDPRLGAGRVQLLICDCDGVLVDSEASGNSFIAEYLTGLGFPTTENDALAKYVGRAISSVKDLVESEFGRPLPVDFIEQCSRAETEAVLPTLRSFDGVHDALDLIASAGLLISVASGGTVEKMHATLGKTDLLDRLLPWLVSSEDVGPGKPAPDVFLAAAAQRGVEPRHCVVIEDSAPGLAAARAAGMATIGFASHLPAAELIRLGADVAVQRWPDVPALLGVPARLGVRTTATGE